jgi:hypothetical protein
MHQMQQVLQVCRQLEQSIHAEQANFNAYNQNQFLTQQQRNLQQQ